MNTHNLHASSARLPLHHPTEAGISSKALINLTSQLNRANIPMHAILMMRSDKLIFEQYYAPFGPNMLHRMFSICKSLNALAIGLLEQEGKLHPDDKIITYFPDKLPAKVHPYIAAMTIRDMLMMRTCHASTTYKYDWDCDWVESFFTTHPTHQPGHVFRYDTSAAHVLCQLAERLSGENMLDYLKDKVLREIGWSEESYILKNQFGESQGGSGLMCTPVDLCLLGQLLLQHGNWNGKQLLPRDFVDIAVSNLTPTYATGPSSGELPGYGYQIWCGERNNFVLYGMGGQFVICMPKYDLVFVTCADTQGLPHANRIIFDALYDNILSHIDHIALTETEPKKTLPSNPEDRLYIKPLSEYRTTYSPENTCQKQISGTIYKITDNTSNFNNLSISFDETDNEGNISYTLNETPCCITFGTKRCTCGSFPLYEQYYAASGCWISPTCFLIKCYLLDTSLGHILIELSFKGTHLQVCMRKQEETLFNEYACFLEGNAI